MKRIKWFEILLRCRDCGRTSYRPAYGDRRCRWCCDCPTSGLAPHVCSCPPRLWVVT